MTLTCSSFSLPPLGSGEDRLGCEKLLLGGPGRPRGGASIPEGTHRGQQGPGELGRRESTGEASPEWLGMVDGTFISGHAKQGSLRCPICIA